MDSLLVFDGLITIIIISIRGYVLFIAIIVYVFPNYVYSSRIKILE